VKVAEHSGHLLAELVPDIKKTAAAVALHSALAQRQPRIIAPEPARPDLVGAAGVRCRMRRHAVT
jgi:hypothetical protein